MDEELEAEFGAVDQFAIALGVAGDDPRRVEAGVQFELTYNLTGGHSFLPEDKLIAATARLLTVEEDTVRQAVARLLEVDRLNRERLAGITVIYQLSGCFFQYRQRKHGRACGEVIYSVHMLPHFCRKTGEC